MDAARIAHALADAAYDAWQDASQRPDLHEEVGMGADGTPTSRIDRILDEAILDLAADIGISVLSEEAGHVDNGSRETAVVDPLDGSRNAGRGIPLFCTSVGVGTDSLLGLQAGVVRSLVTGDRYEARRGAGAFVNRTRVEQRPFDPSEVIVAFMADYEDPQVLGRMQRRHHHMRDLGSAAMEMCLVGTGALDAFDARTEQLRVIDVAAAALFVREAGGLVLATHDWSDLDTPFDLAVRTSMVAAHSKDAWEAVR